MKTISFILLSAVVCLHTAAQASWPLQKCIDYALRNSVSMKMIDVQQRLVDLSLAEQNASRWPSLSFIGNSGYRFGLSENPTTGTLQSSNFLSSGFSLSANATLFNWFSKQYSLKASKAEAAAQAMAFKKAANDLVLNVQAAYLQALLAKELHGLAILQLQQTALQVEATKKKISAGVLSNLDAAQIALRFITDSASCISSLEVKERSALQLKAVIALDADIPFDVESINVDTLFGEAFASLRPEKTFALALETSPAIKQVNLQLEGAAQKIKAAKAARLPAFSLYGSVASNFVNIPSAQSFRYIPQQATGAKVQVGGTNYDVTAPAYEVTRFSVTPFFQQLYKNFGQNIGLSVSIPIFNSKSLTSTVSRENLSRLQLKLQGDKLQQDVKSAVYIAYNEAKASFGKVGINERILVEATKVFEGSQKKYNLNLLSTQELLISRTVVEKAKVDLLLSKFEMVFKLMLLDSYQR